jgi:drug/metabolite transporter (DMT)-like permease
MATAPDDGSAGTGAVVGETRWASSAALLDARRSHRRGQGFVALAALAWSTAGLLQRGLSVGAATQVGVRAAFAGVALLAYVAVTERGRVGAAFRSAGSAGLGVALALATASATFIVALNHTTVAHVLFIQAMAPVLAALLARVALGEPISARTAVAVAVALAGVAVMVGGATGQGRLIGEALSFLMTVAFGLIVVLQRRHPEMSLTSINTLGSLSAAAIAFSLAPPQAVGLVDLIILAAFGLATVCIAFVMFMDGAKLIPAAESALINMAEAVLAPIWVLVLFRENPGASAMIGGALVLGAVLWRIAPDFARGRAATEPADVGAPPLL